MSSSDALPSPSPLPDVAGPPATAADAQLANESEKHPRSRRKRTVGTDKAILEQAYQSNAKPDKTGRLQLVRRVSLNEKEVQVRDPLLPTLGCCLPPHRLSAADQEERIMSPMAGEGKKGAVFPGFITTLPPVFGFLEFLPDQQIWFQNRRQNDRKRSRPLSVQELDTVRAGCKSCGSTAAPMASSASNPTDISPVCSQTTLTSASMSGSTVPSSSQGSNPFSALSDSPPGLSGPPMSSQESSAATVAISFCQCVDSATSAGSPGRVGFVANRWSGSRSLSATSAASFGQLDAGTVQFAPADCPPSSSDPLPSGPPVGTPPPEPDSALGTMPLPPHSPTPPRPKVRIRLSLDGKAELVSGDSSPARAPPSARLPSPALPTVRERRRLGAPPSQLLLPRTHKPAQIPCAQSRPLLQRSQSAAATLPGPAARSAHRPPNSAFTGRPPPPTLALARGRSRDALAWELCCDADALADAAAARDPLAAQAQNEANGSAVAAISLLRSAAALRPSSSTKHNSITATGAAHSSDRRRPRPAAADPQPKRRRLGRSMSATPFCAAPTKKTPAPALLLAPATDSDKENWSPTSDGVPAPPRARRPLPSAPPPDLHHPMAATPTPVQASPGKRGDLDCIAGLLSLSQGNWR